MNEMFFESVFVILCSYVWYFISSLHQLPSFSNKSWIFAHVNYYVVFVVYFAHVNYYIVYVVSFLFILSGRYLLIDG